MEKLDDKIWVKFAAAALAGRKSIERNSSLSPGIVAESAAKDADAMYDEYEKRMALFRPPGFFDHKTPFPGDEE